MKSAPLQLLVTLLATATAAGFLIHRGLPPSMYFNVTLPHDDVRQISRLLHWHHSVDPRFADYCDTPMRYAIVRNRVGVARVLLTTKGGLSRFDRPPDGHPPMVWAASLGTTEMMDALVSCGADVNAVDLFGASALHKAAAISRIEAVEWLLAHGALVDARDNRGRTPLHMACATLEPCEPVAALLIEHGADISAVDNEGRTPLACARRRKAESIIDLLRRHGATD